MNSKRDGDGQDTNGKKPRYKVHIDVRNQSESGLMDNFEEAVRNHEVVIDAVRHGIDLVLVSDGNKPEKIHLTTDDFVHNSDNDYSEDDSVPICKMRV